MRIAMLTLNAYDNYGNTLQKYALYRTLKKFADTVEILWLTSMSPFIPYELELNRQAVGNLRNVAFMSVRQNKFKEFNEANMRTRFDIPNLLDLADEYDLGVCAARKTDCLRRKYRCARIARKCYGRLSAKNFQNGACVCSRA